MHRISIGAIHLFALTVMLLVWGSPFTSHAERQRGVVQSGNTPLTGSSVTLYSAGTSRGASAAMLGQATTDRNGIFAINYSQPPNPGAVLYLVADGFLPARATAARKEVRLATVLGTGQPPPGIVINERTTVATAYAMAQFIQGENIAGPAPGLPNAAATLKNLVNVETGQLARVLAAPPNGNQTSTMAEFNSLSNLLAGCINASTALPCNAVFAAAQAPGGALPANTLDAAVSIAHNPGNNAAKIFLLSGLRRQYQPVLQSAPDAWTIAIRYEGNGHELDGPGNMAIDQDGNVWSTNNYEYTQSPFKQACGGTYAIKLTPDGRDAPGAPYFGGGLYGAGFGITLDAQGDAWLGNFGFQGISRQERRNGQKPPKCVGNNTTVSGFEPDGTPLSANGFNNGGIQLPQGMTTDPQGNLWIANCGANTVVQYPDANPYLAQPYPGLPLHSPFGIAVDAQNNVWVSNNAQDSNGNYTVVELGPDGKMIGTPLSGGGIKAPIDLAVDSLGNVWVANSGVLPVPCASSDTSLLASKLNSPAVPSITEISSNGDSTFTLSNFTGGGLTLPWGIAVDGNDNVWVANFGRKRLSEFCGARPANCPAGLKTGDPISPFRGYSSDGLTRNTGIAIDPSGNVWLANNWLEVPIQTNPGGRHLVVFVGLAAPVRTPIAGPPRQP